MDALKQIDDDEAFDAKLRENLSLEPDQKRRRLAQVDKIARSNCNCEHDAYAQRIDVLEYPTDVPMMPMYGNMLPSERFYREPAFKQRVQTTKRKEPDA